MIERSLAEEAIFAQAVKIGPAGARAAFLDRACEGDERLRSAVEALLSARQPGGDEPDRRVDPEKTVVEPSIDRMAETILGPYRLLEQIGEGGFGMVYMAEQREPIQRRVAVKVIKPGMDSRQVVARFEAERQALAMMDHVNIARVFDAGCTPAGRPYFVMELVCGIPITQYCDANRLTPRERLELFVPLCQAIQHAHQKGIIHRDIKPSNVLITIYDGKPAPKVIDFGVAKATEQQLTDRTLFTQYGTMVGTFEYVSPEQAEMSAIGADTRSDIYSLGVMLYELLTGTTPLQRRRAKESSYVEIVRIIKEEEPIRPSKQLGKLGEDLPSVSANRKTEPGRLVRLLRGELDCIVMKCLEKDRNRRYESVGALAADVQRYLNDEPVRACPASASYRCQKFVRRHLAAVATASALALILLLGVATLAVSNVWIRQAQARTQAETERAQQAQQLARRQAEQIQQGLEGLKAANAMLDRGRWHMSQGELADAYEAFTRAGQLRPDHVSVWAERADLHLRLGLWDLAAVDHASNIELRQPDTIGRWHQYALLLAYLGDTDGYRQLCGTMRERFGGSVKASIHEVLLRSSVLAPNPDLDLTPLVQLSQNLVARHPESSHSLYILGTAHYRAGEDEQAVARLREALVASDWSGRHAGYPVLAMAYYRQGRAREAREALDEAARVLDQWTEQRYSQGGRPPVHHRADVAWPVDWWTYLEGQLYYREAKALIDGCSPPADPRLHVLRARSLSALRWPDRADREYATALKLSPLDPQIVLEAHCNRGYCYLDCGQWGQAAAEFAEACELQPDNSYLWRFRAIASLAAGDLHVYRQACSMMLDRFEGTEVPETAGNVLLACVLRDDSVSDMSRLLPLTHVADAAWHWGSWAHGAALYRAGRYEDAVRRFETSATMYCPRAWDWSFLAMAHQRLGRAAEARRCAAEAERWIVAANQREFDDPTGTQPDWGGWHERVVYPLLLREAEALIAASPRGG